MAEWRYEARDLRTGTLLGWLPLGAVSMQEQFENGALRGILSARLNLEARSGTGARLTSGFLDGTRLARTVIWVYRDERIYDGFIVWNRPKRIGTTHLELSAASLLSYFGARTLNVTKSYSGHDQSTIARDLVNWAQQQPGGDINVEVPVSLTGVVRQALPLAYGYERKTIGQLLDDMADNEDGFEYSIDASVVDDEPVGTFRVWYPRRGRDYEQTGFLLLRSGDRSGNILDYGLDESGTRLATTVHAIGAGEGTSMLIQTAPNTSLIDRGWPLLETVISHKDVSVASTLARHARNELRIRSRIAETGPWQIRVDPDDATVPFGSWTVGDEARVVIEDDERFPAGTNGEPGFEQVLRIVGETVAVSDDGAADQIILTLEVLDA